VWEHDSVIYGRLVNADKSFTGPEFKIAWSEGSRTVRDPAVGYDPQSDQFLVVWSDTYGWDDIYAQLVGVDGSMAAPKIELALATGYLLDPAVTFDSSSHCFLVAWEHMTCHTTFDCEEPENHDWDIYGAFYRATAHFRLYLPLTLRNPSPSPPPMASATPTATPTSTPTSTPTPTATPTATPTSTPTGTPGMWVTILGEDFEGSFPGEWRVLDDEPGAGEYLWGKRDCRVYAGNYSGWAVGDGADGRSLACGSDYPHDAKSWMIYGPFSLADATAAEMGFKAWVNTEEPARMYDYLCWFASTDGAVFHGDCTYGDSSGWVDQVLDLSNVPGLGDLIGQPNVWVALWFQSDAAVSYPEGAYVDDIILRKCTGGDCAGSSHVMPDADRPGFYTYPAVKSLALP
jgi:hypothetical protein